MHFQGRLLCHFHFCFPSRKGSALEGAGGGGVASTGAYSFLHILASILEGRLLCHFLFASLLGKGLVLRGVGGLLPQEQILFFISWLPY